MLGQQKEKQKRLTGTTLPQKDLNVIFDQIDKDSSRWKRCCKLLSEEELKGLLQEITNNLQWGGDTLPRIPKKLTQEDYQLVRGFLIDFSKAYKKLLNHNTQGGIYQNVRHEDAGY
jgi:hypothetical protein